MIPHESSMLSIFLAQILLLGMMAHCRAGGQQLARGLLTMGLLTMGFLGLGDQRNREFVCFGFERCVTFDIETLFHRMTTGQFVARSIARYDGTPEVLGAWRLLREAWSGEGWVSPGQRVHEFRESHGIAGSLLGQTLRWHVHTLS